MSREPRLIEVRKETDLSAAVEFDWDSAARNIQAVRPGMEMLRLSTKTGEGMSGYLEFLEARLSELRKEPVPGGPA